MPAVGKKGRGSKSPKWLLINCRGVLAVGKGAKVCRAVSKYSVNRSHGLPKGSVSTDCIQYQRVAPLKAMLAELQNREPPPQKQSSGSQFFWDSVERVFGRAAYTIQASSTGIEIDIQASFTGVEIDSDCKFSEREEQARC